MRRRCLVPTLGQVFFRWLLGVSAVLLVVAGPASAHSVSAEADVQLAQTVGGVELTVVIRRTLEIPGPLYVDLIAYQPDRDLTIDLAVGDSAATARLRRDRAGTYPVVLNVGTTGLHELRLKAAGEVSVLPFQVRLAQPPTWELVVYSGFGATGLMFAVALVAGVRARRTTALALGGVGVVASVIAATVAVVSPQLGQEQRDFGRPNAQAFLTTTPAQPAVGEEFTVRFDLVDGSTGRPADDLAAHHGALAHLVITSQDGEFFRHLHPLRTAPGRAEVRLTADRPGRYLAHAEFERTDAGGQLVSGTFDIGGSPLPPPARPVAWTFPQGRPVTIEIDTGTTGLQSWLGMAGHLIVRSQTGDFLGHVHEQSVMSSTSDGTVAAHGPLLRFTTSFPRPGRYFAWLQYAKDFQIVTVPYVIEVEDSP
jgi:hypothetical protein